MELPTKVQVLSKLINMHKIYPILSRLLKKILPITMCLLWLRMAASHLSNLASTNSSLLNSVEDSQRWALEKYMKATTSCKTLWFHSIPRMCADASREGRHSTPTNLALTNYSIVWNLLSTIPRPRSWTKRCTLLHCVKWTWCKFFSRKSLASPR